MEKLEFVVNNSFERLTYTEAIDILKSNHHKKRNSSTRSPAGAWTCRVNTNGTGREAFKNRLYYQLPAAIKAFYMRPDDNCAPDGKPFRRWTSPLPASARSWVVRNRKNDWKSWSKDERHAHPGRRDELVPRYPALCSCPHAGFGLGFERLVQFVTGMGNIRM